MKPKTKCDSCNIKFYARNELEYQHNFYFIEACSCGDCAADSNAQCGVAAANGLCSSVKEHCQTSCDYCPPPTTTPDGRHTTTTTTRNETEQEHEQQQTNKTPKTHREHTTTNKKCGTQKIYIN